MGKRRHVRHFMPWVPQDYRDSRIRTQSMLDGDPLLRLLYLEILNALWVQGGTLPSDPKKLRSFVGLSAADIAERLPSLLAEDEEDRGGIRIEGEFITNTRVTEDIAESDSFRDQASKAGKASVETRKKRFGTAQPTRTTVREDPNDRSTSPERSPNGSRTALERPPNLPLPSPLPTPQETTTLGHPAEPYDREPDFVRVYSAYPKKVGKEDGFKLWLRYKKTKVLPPTDELVSAIETQKKSEKWQGGYIYDFDRWMRGKHWQDKLDPMLPFGGNGSSPPNAPPAEREVTRLKRGDKSPDGSLTFDGNELIPTENFHEVPQ